MNKNEKLKKLFAQHRNEGNSFSAIKNKKSQRPDVHGIILLDELFPGSYPIIADEGMQDFSVKIHYLDLARKLTSDNVLELVRCGFEYVDFGLCRPFDGLE